MTYRTHGHSMQVNLFSPLFVYVLCALGIVGVMSFALGRGAQVVLFTPLWPVVREIRVAPQAYSALPVAKSTAVVPTVFVGESIVKKFPVVTSVAKPVQTQMRLQIPRIGVDTVVRHMGETLEGAMAVPNNAIEVGWYSLGTMPGDIGSAVIGGHSSWEARASVFANLDQLVVGDIVSIINSRGVVISFIVREMRTFEATDTESGIFESTDGSHPNLITCSGPWDPAINTYATRLVVFTDLIEAPTTIAAVPDPVL